MRIYDIGTPKDRDIVVHDKILTVANAITVTRMAGLPIFAWLMVGPKNFTSAFGVLVVIAATDWIDGFVARRFDQVTKLGQILDPLIDRALLGTAALTMAVVGILPWWVVIAIGVRDVVLIIGAGVLARENTRLPVTYLGKTATACLMIGIPSSLLGATTWDHAGIVRQVAWVFLIGGLIAYYVAAVDYALAARRISREAGDDSPAQTQTRKDSE